MLRRILPFISWFRDYSFQSFRVDVVSGVTVALVLIPQSMAYAQLAGLPAYYGLYASFLPPMIAALFGSSRQLATGPVAIVSLMTAASLEPLATAGSEAYIAYAILLALLVGLFQLALGVLRLGLVVNFLSHPVVNGFTNAAALIIASSQLSKLFGVYVDKADHHYETIFRVIKAAFHYTHWPTLGMGALAFAVMYGLRRLNPRLPNVLIAVVITTLLSWATGFQHDVKVPVTAIKSPKVQTLIREFDDTVKLIPVLAAQRTDFMIRAEKAKEELGAHASTVLALEHKAKLIGMEIESLKEEAHVRRRALRTFLFYATPEDGSPRRFFLREEFPQDLENDGRTWRIKVGNNPLDEQAITMSGGGAVVGVIPEGLPSLAVPKVDLRIMIQLFPFAAIISLLGFMEAIAIAKAMAAKTGQRLDPNQELIGQGLANIAGSIGQSYPTSGSFSRSAVNLQAGAVSGISSVVTSIMVVIVLLFFTPLLYHLPQASLAAVIMMAVIGLVNVSGFIHSWQAQKYDGIISIVTFVATLVFAPELETGILLGVALSLGVFLYKSMRPRVAVLAMHPDCSFRDAEHYGLKQCRHIAVIRFDGPLFFANASFLEDQITERMANSSELKHILIVANGINDMDASGEEVLSLLVGRIRSAGLDISFSHVKESVLEVMRRTHLYELIGEDHIYPTQAAAIAALHGLTHKDSTETDCPLVTVCKLEDYREPADEDEED